MRRLGLGGDDKTAGVLVEAVDDPRPAHPADPQQAVAAMGDERVDERAVGIAGRRVNHQPRGLVDDDEMCILETDTERDRLRLRRCILRFGENYDESLAVFHLARGVADHDAVIADLAGEDQLLEPAAGVLGHPRLQGAVEPLPVAAGLDGDGRGRHCEEPNGDEAISRGAISRGKGP